MAEENPSYDLILRAKQYVRADRDLMACWNLVLRAIEVGWLDRDDVEQLLDSLRAGRDFGIEELLFSHIGERLRVSFLDERGTCSPSAMIDALTAIR